MPADPVAPNTNVPVPQRVAGEDPVTKGLSTPIVTEFVSAVNVLLVQVTLMKYVSEAVNVGVV